MTSRLEEDGCAKPFWSVMIPTYHPDEKYLRQALESVLQQDRGPEQMQIEVVDDGSPARDVESMVKSLGKGRVAFFRTPENLGLAGCWNACVARARGEWIHILHQDDLVFPGFYESLRRGIAACPQAGAAYCRHAYCDENGHWQRLSFLERPQPGVLQNFVECLMTQERIQCASIVVKQTTYAEVGQFNPDLKHALDWEMWIRIASKFPIYYEPQILACWRNHPNASTSRQIRSGENIRDIVKAIGLLDRHVPGEEGRRLSALIRDRIAREGLWTARQLLAQNDWEGSLNQTRAALLCKPAFRLQVVAAKIRIKAWAKKMLCKCRARKSAAQQIT